MCRLRSRAPLIGNVQRINCKAICPLSNKSDSGGAEGQAYSLQRDTDDDCMCGTFFLLRRVPYAKQLWSQFDWHFRGFQTTFDPPRMLHIQAAAAVCTQGKARQ